MWPLPLPASPQKVLILSTKGSPCIGPLKSRTQMSRLPTTPDALPELGENSCVQVPSPHSSQRTQIPGFPVFPALNA